ncbi:MAG: GNAT family N-acetyltransferase [Ruegeria sp.]
MINIRPAQKTDLAAITQCVASAYADARQSIPDLPDVTSGLAQDIDQYQVFVAEKEGAVVGVVVFGSDNDKFMIFNLAVQNQMQGQGVASRLMACAENQAREESCKRMELRTHKLMHGTRAMYAHMGWVETEVTENKVSMQKDLD